MYKPVPWLDGHWAGPYLLESEVNPPVTGTSTDDNWQEFAHIALLPPPNTPATITVQKPMNKNVAPPGWYMLTVVNDSGVASVAQWVKVGGP